MTNIVIVLLFMLFAHIVDDYYLQGILASMKQKGWWQKNAPEEKYKYDYIPALICHAFSWSVMILLPIFIASSFIAELWWLCIVAVCNTAIHAVVDNAKANWKKLNLIQDQLIHIAQILVTWLLWVIV